MDIWEKRNKIWIWIFNRKWVLDMKKIIRFIKDRDIFIIFALFVGILTYMVGLRDRAEAEAFENEQNKIKENLIEKVDD